MRMTHHTSCGPCVPVQVALAPDWQRRMLGSAEQARPGSLALLQSRLAAIYTDSVCNATHGCNALYGQCVNTSHLPVYQYDQNGTCACHHWYMRGLSHDAPSPR